MGAKYLAESKTEKEKEQWGQRNFRQESNPEWVRRWKPSDDMAGGGAQAGLGAGCWGSPWCGVKGIESLNHRMVWVGRDL